MEFGKIKEEIIDTLKDSNDCCSYIDVADDERGFVVIALSTPQSP